MRAELISEEEKEDMAEPDYFFKVILIGNSNVGKSSMLRNITGNIFEDSIDATVGMDFRVLCMKIEDKIIKLQIWDTAGQETF